MTRSATPTQAIEIAAGRVIRADLAIVWSILGDFGTEHRWASQLKQCRRSTDWVRVGTVRSCTHAKPIMGRSAIEEELTEFEPGRALTYRLRGGAGPFRSAEGRWRVSPVKNGTLVEVSGRFQPHTALVKVLPGGLARASARRAAHRALDDFARYVERQPTHGSPHG